MKKAEKTIFVDNLTEELKSAKSIVLVNYTGLSVKMQQILKERLFEVGAKMVVVKNTLLKRAGESAKIDSQILSENILSGQTALVISTKDPIAAIQILGQFAKEFEVPQMKVGVVEGLFQDSQSLSRISSLPSKDALLGQLLGTLISPLYGLTGTLQGNISKLVYILNVKAQMSNLKLIV